MLTIRLITLLSILLAICEQSKSQEPKITTISIKELFANNPGLKERLDKEIAEKKSKSKPDSVKASATEESSPKNGRTVIETPPEPLSRSSVSHENRPQRNSRLPARRARIIDTDTTGSESSPLPVVNQNSRRPVRPRARVSAGRSRGVPVDDNPTPLEVGEVSNGRVFPSALV